MQADAIVHSQNIFSLAKQTSDVIDIPGYVIDVSLMECRLHCVVKTSRHSAVISTDSNAATDSIRQRLPDLAENPLNAELAVEWAPMIVGYLHK